MMNDSFTEDKRMLEYGLMKSYPNIFCFSTTRHGGYGSGEYASFNCNPFCGDDAETVRRNRLLLERLMPQRPRKLIVPHQTHGTEVRVIDESFLTLPDAVQAERLEGVDALVTDRTGVCLCISTADCVPVLCFDTRRRVVAAAHAGWRGTVQRIVARTLRMMAERYGTNPNDVAACIGPSISQEAFEVGDEVYNRFRDEGFPMERIAVHRDKWHIDLWEANRLQLLSAGVSAQNIAVSGICTWQNNADFFSARRQGIASGRILSGIMLLDGKTITHINQEMK